MNRTKLDELRKLRKIENDYVAAYLRHFSLWEASLRSVDSVMARISSDLPLEEALSVEALPKKLLEYAH